MPVSEKILIIDDHPVVLDGITLSLDQVMNDAILITALNGADAREVVTNHKDIDWIFVDVNLPDTNGVELIKAFETMKVTANIIVLSSDDSPNIIDSALKQHASGFLSKSFNKNELQECFDTVEKGQIYLSKEHKQQLNIYRTSVLKEKQSIEENMSKRQFQTLQLLANGYSNQEIASSLNIVESTVKSHVHALMAIFDADNRTHCVSEARRLHIIV